MRVFTILLFCLLASAPASAGPGFLIRDVHPTPLSDAATGTPVGTGGSITGTVVEAVTGMPVHNAEISVWRGTDQLAGRTFTGQDGIYSQAGLARGTYFVTVATQGRYPIELYDDLTCSLGGFTPCDVTAGTPVEVRVAETTSGIDFVLQERSTVSGRVIDSSTGAGIAYAAVTLYDEAGTRVSFAGTVNDGSFAVRGLDPGTYFATCQANGYLYQLYGGANCETHSPECPDPTLGTPIVVGDDSTVSGIDFHLSPDGCPQNSTTLCLNEERFQVEVDWRTSSGTAGSGQAVRLTPDTGYFWFFNAENVELVVKILDGCFAPFDSFWVFAAGLTDVEATITVTDTVTGDVGTYRNPLGTPFRPILDVGAFATCGAQAAPLPLSPADTARRFDAASELRGSISGRVSVEFTDEPLPVATVTILSPTGEGVANANPGVDGSYVVPDLEAGTYFATAISFLYRRELFSEIPCDGPCEDVTQGTPIIVEPGATTAGVDFTLDLVTGITGTVTEEATGLPLPDVSVQFRSRSSAIGFIERQTNAVGRYSLPGLVGTFLVATTNELGFVDEVYDDVSCPEGLCDVMQATPITLAASQVINGIDFALAAPTCLPGATSACLNRGRFQVEVIWTTPGGQTGRGQAVRLTPDTGYFWFFDRDNVELVVKILDGCFAPFDSFWVFAAGLTDVEAEVIVTDTETGLVRRYSNPQGTPFEPVLDTAAFPTCP